MDFKVERKPKPQAKQYAKTDIDIAYAFSKTVHREFGSMLRAIVLFGSTAESSAKEHGDIDILLIVDDVTYVLTPELVETYRLVIEKTIINTSTKIHVTTLKLTTFWEYVRVGDPVVINMLRSGVGLLDTGFFYPLQLLLYQGRIRPTEEAAHNYYSRAPSIIFNAKGRLLQAMMDLYWGTIDAAHAAIMLYGEMPPPPKEVAAKLDAMFVQKKLLHKVYVQTMQKMYDFSKKIIHREIKEVKGIEFDGYVKEAEEFVKAMKVLMDKKAEK